MSAFARRNNNQTSDHRCSERARLRCHIARHCIHGVTCHLAPRFIIQVKTGNGKRANALAISSSPAVCHAKFCPAIAEDLLVPNAIVGIEGAMDSGQHLRAKKTRRAPNSSRSDGIFSSSQLENSKTTSERADSVNRTRDLLITNQLLYLLSYVG